MCGHQSVVYVDPKHGGGVADLCSLAYVDVRNRVVVLVCTQKHVAVLGDLVHGRDLYLERLRIQRL